MVVLLLTESSNQSASDHMHFIFNMLDHLYKNPSLIFIFSHLLIFFSFAYVPQALTRRNDLKVLQ